MVTMSSLGHRRLLFYVMREKALELAHVADGNEAGSGFAYN